MDQPNPYNYNNDDHYYQDNNHSNQKFIESGGNKDFVQFMLILLLFISFSRAFYECNHYFYLKLVNSCKKRRLTCRRLNSSDEDKLLNECSICLEHYVKNEKIIELSCKHTFHEKCIKEWMDTNNISNNTCPICRENII